MEKGGFLVYVISFLLILLIYILLKRNKRESKRKAKLPPGSMGWPYIGETLQLYSQDPSVFFTTKQRRYFLFFIFFPNLYFFVSFSKILFLVRVGIPATLLYM